MATSSYLKYLPPVLWSPRAPAGGFDLGAMLCVFEKILTGLDDGVAIGHGDNSVLTTVIQGITGGPLPQTARLRAGDGVKFRPGSSYTYQGATPEVINVLSTTANTLTAVFRRNHAASQAIVNSTGPHRDIQSVIAGLVALYGAWTTPSEAFDWLAQWVALQADPVWDDYQRRSVLSKIVGIYTLRGTKPGLDRFFDIYALARQRPRVVVDNASKILFCAPRTGAFAPTPTLVSQLPLVAPQCVAFDPAGYLLVGDLGSHDATVPPAVWRVSTTGDYDFAAGPLPAPQAYQTATAPLAIAVDPVNGGAYLIDLILDYELRRLTAPQVGSITLTGTPDPAQTATITVAGTAYTLPQTGGPTLAGQATAWATALNAATPFNTRYTASAAGPVITLGTLSGAPGNDLTLVTTSSAALQLTAKGPGFAASAVFASNAAGPPPPLALKLPRAMVVNAAGIPLILDRGAVIAAASATAVIEVTMTTAPPTYTGNVRHALAAISEPLSMARRADGSLIIGDGGNQVSAAPADLWSVNTATWAATSLLGGMAAGSNPLVAPVGVVEVDASHLLVLDAGLRPYVPSAASPFTVVIARQAALYQVDLSVAPPVITRASEFGAGTYPRAMVGDSKGTVYICESGLPDLQGYSARLWRSKPQQMSVVVHFQGNPARSVSSLTLGGTPTSGEQCQVTIASATYTLPEVTGNTLAQQAQAWAAALNAAVSFNGLYTALPVGNLICLYAAANTSTTGAVIVTTGSAGMTLAAGRLAAGVTLSGVPTTGEHLVLDVAGSPYILDETTGQTLAQQTATWAAFLNAATPFNQSHVAAAAGEELLVNYKSSDVADNLPSFVNGSLSLHATLAAPPLALGTVSLSGTPTTGESCVLKVGLLTFTLAETTGFTLGQQTAAWAGVLNGTPGFAASYVAMNAGATIMLFAGTAVGPTGATLSSTSSAHLVMQTYSELQNRNRFLQSIRDVVADEIPAHARWYLQSELSQL
jgi:phage tail-like protein